MLILNLQICEEGGIIVLKTYRVTYVRMGVYYLEGYNIEGACQLLDAMGYTCTEREYKEEE